MPDGTNYDKQINDFVDTYVAAYLYDKYGSYLDADALNGMLEDTRQNLLIGIEPFYNTQIFKDVTGWATQQIRVGTQVGAEQAIIESKAKAFGLDPNTYSIYDKSGKVGINYEQLKEDIAFREGKLQREQYAGKVYDRESGQWVTPEEYQQAYYPKPQGAPSEEEWQKTAWEASPTAKEIARGTVAENPLPSAEEIWRGWQGTQGGSPAQQEWLKSMGGELYERMVGGRAEDPRTTWWKELNRMLGTPVGTGVPTRTASIEAFGEEYGFSPEEAGQRLQRYVSGSSEFTGSSLEERQAMTAAATGAGFYGGLTEGQAKQIQEKQKQFAEADPWKEYLKSYNWYNEFMSIPRSMRPGGTTKTRFAPKVKLYA